MVTNSLVHPAKPYNMETCGINVAWASGWLRLHSVNGQHFVVRANRKNWQANAKYCTQAPTFGRHLLSAFQPIFTSRLKQSPVERRNILGRHELLTLDNLIVLKAKC
ncbi:uncharacterized protein Dyak_GE29223 [Drosophila yakuba]|uniref:Uncharacterized protein n=1 Tax=Drosophila yakuba TaxID=7245 RepID=A0A0R1E2P7_DROYA|nr:uncharacterized protein Dyak_GE29223 [Drosophila yakuba]